MAEALAIKMAQFAIILTHSSDQCPVTNSKTRKLFESTGPKIPELGKKHGVKFLAGPLITTEHKAVGILEARDNESVRKFIMESGLIQWNSVQVLHGVSMEEAGKEVAGLTALY